MAEYSFPTETIDLPSGGKLYPEGSPLRSGTIDIKYMTAKEEDMNTIQFRDYQARIIHEGTKIIK